MNFNTQLYYKSFLPSVIRDWNEIPQEIPNSNSLSTFKRKLNAELNMPPTYYKERKRLGQICNSYTMGCPPVRGDNPRALASELSYVQVDNHGITILNHLHKGRPCTSRDISC